MKYFLSPALTLSLLLGISSCAHQEQKKLNTSSTDTLKSQSHTRLPSGEYESAGGDLGNRPNKKIEIKSNSFQAVMTVPDFYINVAKGNDYTDLSQLQVKATVDCQEYIFMSYPEGATRKCQIQNQPYVTEVSQGVYKVSGGTFSHTHLGGATLTFVVTINGHWVFSQSTARNDVEDLGELSKKVFYVTTIPLFKDSKITATLMNNHHPVEITTTDWMAKVHLRDFCLYVSYEKDIPENAFYHSFHASCELTPKYGFMGRNDAMAKAQLKEDKEKKQITISGRNLYYVSENKITNANIYLQGLSYVRDSIVFSNIKKIQIPDLNDINLNQALEGENFIFEFNF